MGADEIQYRCHRCAADARAMAMEHQHEGLNVCLGCWRDLQPKDAAGRIPPSDPSDAPWMFATVPDAWLHCACDCHGDELPDPEPPRTCDDAWVSDFHGDEEGRPTITKTIICVACVNANHGRFY